MAVWQWTNRVIKETKVRPYFLWIALLVTPILMAQTSSKQKARSKQPAVSAKAVQQLREALAVQQQQIEAQRQQMEQLKSQLQQLLDVTQQAKAAAQKIQGSADMAQTTAGQAQQSASEAQRLADQASANAVETKTALSVVNGKAQDEEKRLSALQDLLGRFRFAGDVRIRGENFTQQGAQDRNRARIRARFGVEGKLNEDFNGAIYVATGSLGDPTTTNETFTNLFDRKTIALDKAFITYNPIAHNWISLTAGKFPYLWQRTSVTGDPDLNPEGFDQKFAFDLKNSVVKNFTIQGIELLYNESSAGQDSYALGAQASAKLQIGPWTATPSFLSLKWNRPDAILQASAFAVQASTTGSTTAGSFPVPGEGQGCQSVVGGGKFAPCPFAPNGLTNATFIDSKGLAHFYSGFNYTDFILNNQFKTGSERFPLNLMLEFEDNLDAENHPLDSAGHVIAGLGPQNKEYGFEFSLGQTRTKNDLQVGYSWYRQEQDSVLASFAESDQRTPTNLIQNRIYALWKLRANTLASFAWWRGRVLNTALENNAGLAQKTITAAGETEPYLNRFQFDLIYTF
jgi:Putative porin/Alanine-zipper, major outer membrane lipoprotein